MGNQNHYFQGQRNICNSHPRRWSCRPPSLQAAVRAQALKDHCTVVTTGSRGALFCGHGMSRRPPLRVPSAVGRGDPAQSEPDDTESTNKSAAIHKKSVGSVITSRIPAYIQWKQSPRRTCSIADLFNLLAVLRCPGQPNCWLSHPEFSAR